jgi:uncharacterized Ntn-hydrolase superfamily protein
MYFSAKKTSHMKKKLLVLWIACVTACNLKAQDTFSILAFDSITGEVGAAGASCVDLFQFPGYSNDFITELFPGDGAIATQAYYLPANQQNARSRMVLGETPDQIISWLQLNDAGGNPSIRQYGIVRMVSGSAQSAAFTGTNCMDYKDHIIGPNYSIQGNILLGALVLDSMEARFKREKGDLACKLMAAMQGANMIGADSRCSGNGSSSLFAFIKVSQPTDDFGSPSFLKSLKTANGAGIEPIDSLQKLFDAERSCLLDQTGISKKERSGDEIQVFPVPASDRITIKLKPTSEPVRMILRNTMGVKVGDYQFTKEMELEISHLRKGIYFLEIEEKDRLLVKKISIQ